MTWFLYLISAIWIAFGSCAILYTTETRDAARKLLQTSPKFLCAIPIIGGVLLILSATASIHPWIIRLLGVLALIKGGFIFVNPDNLFGKFTAWYLEEMSDQSHRFTGILTVILGTAVMSWIL